MSELARSVERGLRTLLFPIACLGCGAANSQLCPECAIQIQPRSWMVREWPFSITASLKYDEFSARIVLAAKEDGNKFAGKFLAAALSKSVLFFLESLDDHKKLTLTWIPSTKRAKSRRGRDFAADLAQYTLSEIEKRWRPQRQGLEQIVLRPLFHWTRYVKDQSKLRAHERADNLEGALRVQKYLECRDPIIILDDVVTTGSTLKEAFRALQERNLTPIGAAAACASQRQMLIR